MDPSAHPGVKDSPTLVENSSLVSTDAPWPGLAPFTEEQSGFFYGRSEEIRTLSRLMERKALTVLFGQSGLGKSSLLQAGVFPRLRAAHFCPIYIRLDHGDGAPSPTEQVKAMVAEACQRAGTWTKPGAAKPGETLWEFFHHRDDQLVDATGALIVPVLVLDQFEELFTLGAAAGAQRERAVAFMAELAELVENRPSEKLIERLDQSSAEMDAFDFGRTDYRVCISLREDYLPHLEGLKTIMPALMENRMRLTRMTGTQALEAVIKPGGALVTEEVARAIVEFVSGARGGSIERIAELDVEPPLLSVICHELNERRRALGQARITVDLVSGNRREILTDFYERSVADLPEDVRRFVEDKLLTKSGFRDNLALETALEESGVTRPLIDTLVSRRLLRIEDRIGSQRVELTHDVLADVVRASRDTRQQRLALERAERLRRVEVENAARQARRQRLAIAGLVVAVLALSIGAVLGFRAQRRAVQQSGHTDLVLGSRLLDEGKVSEGLAYLVRAARKDPLNELIAPRLLSTLSARSYLFPVGSPLPLPVPAVAATYSADGRWIFVQGDDDRVRIIDATTWRLAQQPEFGQKVRRGGLTLADRNSDVFAVLLADNTIVVGDTATGKARGRPIKPPKLVFGRDPRFQLSPDGRWIAAVASTQLWLWDAATGDLQETIPVNSFYRNFAFSPDSRKIALTQDLETVMWSIADRRITGEIIKTQRSVVYPRFSADGSRLLVWHYDGVSICDGITGERVRRDILIQAGVTSDIWLSHDGTKIIVATDTRTIRVLDVSTGKDVYPPLIHGGNVASWNTQLVANGTVLFTNCVDGIQRFWDLETGKLLAEPTVRQPQFAPAAVSPDGKHAVVFTASGPAYRLRLGGRPAAPLSLLRTRESTLFVNLSEGSPTRVVWLTFSGGIEVDVASARLTDRRFRFPETVASGGRSPYGATLGPNDLMLVRTAAGAMHAWTMGANGIAQDVALEDSETPNYTGTGVDSKAKYVAFQLGRRRTTAATGAEYAVWDARTGRRAATFNLSNPVVAGATAAPTFSPDGKRIAFRTNDGVVHVCDLKTAKELFTLQLTGKAALQSQRYTADGRRILTGDTWGGIHIWDATDGRLLSSKQYHRTSVHRFDFSSDERFYTSVSSDGTVQVWDAATDQPVGALLEQSGAAARSDFSPDNTRIVTPSSSGSARVWDVRTGLPLTDPMTTEPDSARVVAFSPDGGFVDVHDFANVPRSFVRVWSVPPTPRGVRTPEWLLTLATICAGHRLSDDGKLLDATETLGRIDEVQRALTSAPAGDPFAEWARWILSDGPGRSIAPGFTATAAEAAKFRGEWWKN